MLKPAAMSSDTPTPDSPSPGDAHTSDAHTGDAKISAARSVAFDLLRAVLAKKTPLDEALVAHDGMNWLPDRDRGFARTLVATTLRRLGHVDRMIDACLSQPLPLKASAVRDVLRIAATELLILKVAPHAAVDSAVNLVRSRGHEKFVKLTNAVLRRLDREGSAAIEALPALDALPHWLARSWRATYGDETAEAMAAAVQREPVLDITVKSDPAPWAETLGAQMLPTGTLRRPIEGRIDALPGFAEGAWWVQDAAAALPVKLLGDVAGKTVVDLCAAPGGKTAQLAAAAANVLAVDRAAKRVKRMQENLSRLQLSATCVTADAAKWRPPLPVDAVLLDAPCSATGTLRRHPDIPWLKGEADVAKLVGLQDRLLNAALEIVKPGGTVVFCTCSLESAEGIDRIAALLARNPAVRRVPIAAQEIGGLDALITAEGDLRTRPDHLADFGGMDGFYACRLIKG
ncbi:transcription antitermination factor NusB [Thalassobaculum sp. OXR-137]|uniref:RsmB/NOP family class I SAM-dependent RNA methyltransferase n=1 Tax=Thalassobaculum sp. OXR-137 TaxID=3100173 RepID=UPI002AC9A632|nr:transcription antitermination factor NusB [Thalassobaculum sp. OXR-137]WPZ35322.1 transcription antitermination factor NusB [Thalassobaculum sp. OXR-137]